MGSTSNGDWLLRVFAVLEPINNFDYVQIANVAVLIEAIRIFISNLKKIESMMLG